MSLSVPLPRNLLLSIAERVQLRRALESGVVVERVEIPVRDLPSALNGFTIVHMSDLHIGVGKWEPVYAEEAAQLVRAIEPDVIVNTGDYLQGEPSLDKVMKVVQEFLMNPSKGDGGTANLGILGNHDYYASEEVVDELRARLESAGVIMLINQATCVEQHRGGVSFVGLTVDTDGFDRGVEALMGATRPRVVLIHEPELVERLPAGSADLVLAGHTHGGQITLPGLESLIVRVFSGSHYVAGLYHVNGMPLFVNRGLGTTGVPVRVRARPEITAIRLIRRS